jgi:hypothetical protein
MLTKVKGEEGTFHHYLEGIHHIAIIPVKL